MEKEMSLLIRFSINDQISKFIKYYFIFSPPFLNNWKLDIFEIFNKKKKFNSFSNNFHQ